jgi:predicted O-methyltransferase YrrM
MKFAEDIDSGVTYQECVRLASLAEDKAVLEIGSWYGRSTICMASVADYVVSVDWHQGDFYAGEGETLVAFRNNLRRYGISNVDVIVARIEDIWETLTPGFDVVFIDADHQAESAAEHWRIANELCSPGGYVVFHDYGKFGVTEVVDGVGDVFELVDHLAIFMKEEKDASTV